MEQYIVALITAVVGAAAVAIRQYLQTKLKPQQFNTVIGFAADVVSAAEQAGTKMGWDGPAKYEYAQTSLESLSKRVGINLKPEESNAIIHAAVKGMKDITAYQNDTTEATFQRGVEFGINQLLTEIQTQQQTAPQTISDMATEIVPSGPVGTVQS
jgi:predicted flavoprotein YhiN